MGCYGEARRSQTRLTRLGQTTLSSRSPLWDMDAPHGARSYTCRRSTPQSSLPSCTRKVHHTVRIVCFHELIRFVPILTCSKCPD